MEEIIKQRYSDLNRSNRLPETTVKKKKGIFEKRKILVRQPTGRDHFRYSWNPKGLNGSNRKGKLEIGENHEGQS